MSSAILTLLGLYKYNENLFDGFSNLPSDVEKDLLIDTILMRGGDYEVLYPDADLLQSLITSWSKRYYDLIDQWLRANEDLKDVSPLENYDRYENWTDTGHSTSSNVMSGYGTTTGNDSSTANGSVTGVDTVSAYDNNSLVNNTGTTQGNTTNTNSNTATNSSTNTNNNAESDNNNSHTGHIHGNIGVTTAGAMYREWMEVLSKYGNIYEAVATIFLQSFVIPMY